MVAIPIRENTFQPPNVRRIYTPPAPLAGRGVVLKLVRGDAAFLIISLFLPPSPSNLREKQLNEKIWKWVRSVLDETPSRVVPVLLLDANGHISQTTWPEQIGKYSSKKTTFNGQCLGELLRDHHLQAANTYFLVGATFFGPFSIAQIDFSCLPATVHVRRCCALHHDGDRLQLAAALGRRDHRPIQCVFQHQLTYGMHEKRQDHQWDKNKLTQGALFAQDRTTFLLRVEEACRHDEEWTHLAVTDFWAKLNQVLVDAGSDLYAREIQAKISTPQDTLDARHDMTKAKLEVTRSPPRRPNNQMCDSDLPSDIEWVRHIFTGWRTYSTYWRATATLRRLQRRDKTKKHTQQAQRISDAWDQRDFRTLWSAARAMLSHSCGPKRRRHDIPLSSLPTAAAWATHLRQAGPLGVCLGTKVEWEAQLRAERFREQQGARWAAAEGCSVEPEELEADFRGMVWRLRQSPLRRATPSWAAPGELWRQVVDPMRDNTPKKHGVGCKAQWLAPLFQSRLWQGIGRVRRSGCVPMWWHRSITHRSITFPIDKSNNKEGCNAVRLVNAFFLRTARHFTATSGDGNHKRSRGLMPVDARRTGPDLSPQRSV